MGVYNHLRLTFIMIMNPEAYFTVLHFLILERFKLSENIGSIVGGVVGGVVGFGFVGAILIVVIVLVFWWV